jgi:hypothetical protein
VDEATFGSARAEDVLGRESLQLESARKRRKQNGTGQLTLGSHNGTASDGRLHRASIGRSCCMVVRGRTVSAVAWNVSESGIGPVFQCSRSHERRGRKPLLGRQLRRRTLTLRRRHSMHADSGFTPASSSLSRLWSLLGPIVRVFIVFLQPQDVN